MRNTRKIAKKRPVKRYKDRTRHIVPRELEREIEQSDAYHELIGRQKLKERIEYLIYTGKVKVYNSLSEFKNSNANI